MRTFFLFFCLVTTVFSQPAHKRRSFPIFVQNSNFKYFASTRLAESATWSDFDNDGWVDVYVCRAYNLPNKLFRNLGNGNFEDATDRAHVGSVEYSRCAFWVDLNNDRFLDLYLVTYATDNVLYINQRDGTFTKTTLSDQVLMGYPAWIDLNQDGRLDCYLARYSKTYANNQNSFNRLFYNLGGLRFKDVSAKAYLQTEHYNNWPNWIDANNDGYPDLFVTNTEQKQHYIYYNTKDSVFSENNVNNLIGNFIGDNRWADLNGDGRQDLILLEEKGAACVMLESSPKGFKKASFTLPRLETGFEYLDDFDLLDLDNDGQHDISVRIHKAFSATEFSMRYYHNSGNFQFEDYSAGLPWLEFNDIMNLAWADIDLDGDLDVLILRKSKILLYENQSPVQNYVRVSLRGTPSPPQGTGAKVRVITPGDTCFRWLNMGKGSDWDANGEIIIGLGQRQPIQKITVFWPSGVRQDTLNPPLNQTIQFIEPATHWFDDLTTVAFPEPKPGKYMGGSCADYDLDGDCDFFLNSHFIQSSLYQNQGILPFHETSKPARIIPSPAQMGSLFFDDNNDGAADLYLIYGYHRHNLLMQNNGQGIFNDITATCRIPVEFDSCLSVITADFNNDGYLDLYQGHHGSNKLLLNSATGIFTDRTQPSGTGDKYIAHGMVAFDYDNDGDQDIYVANSRGGQDDYFDRPWPNVLYQNNGQGVFRNVTDSAGVSCELNSKGVAVGDYDNDGDFDLYVANDDTVNILFRNNGNGIFTDVTNQAGVAQPRGAHGCHFADFDGDGDLDLLVAGSSYIPEKHPQSVTKSHPDVLYRNNGDGTFTDITRYSGIQNNLEMTPHLIIADFDNDGYLDVIAANAMGKDMIPTPPTYFHNHNYKYNWIQLKLIGYQSNRDAVGAKVYLKAGTLEMWRQVTFGAGFGSSCSNLVHFGLNRNQKIDKIEIFWPSGIKQKIRSIQQLNRCLTIEEPYRLGWMMIGRKTFNRWSWLGFLLFGGLICYPLGKYCLRLIRRGYRAQKQDRQEAAQALEARRQPHYLEISIELIKLFEDYILTHSIKAGSEEFHRLKAFNWGRQEETAFQLRADRLEAINLDLENVLHAHQTYIQAPHSHLPVPILEELKTVGQRIYSYLGLQGSFKKLFATKQLKNVHLKFVVDLKGLPWHLAYDEIQDQFLCNYFPHSYTLRDEVLDVVPSGARESSLYAAIDITEKTTVLLYSTWRNHPKHLVEVEHEISEINQIFHSNHLECTSIHESRDQFIETLNLADKKMKNLRIIHYAGHIEHSNLTLGPNDHLDPAHLTKIYGISFKSAPIVFLNGCQSDRLWHTQDDIATHFLRAGAAACVVTHGKVPEKTARRFAVLFYKFFVAEKYTVAEALLRTRLAFAHEKNFDPNYDITPYLYNLYGNPLTIC
ncbi:FG-GAP-like repeat-containing protein [candidate division KSB1 bacterium]|nr:FG-GAP-like repeat-containing protein [candidate division KSB1 bacterium]